MNPVYSVFAAISAFHYKEEVAGSSPALRYDPSSSSVGRAPMQTQNTVQKTNKTNKQNKPNKQKFIFLFVWLIIRAIIKNNY